MSIHLDAMLYTDAGKTHLLFPVCIWRNNNLYVIEARMYAEDGEFIGTWPRSTMPLQLIHQLERHEKYILSYRVVTQAPDEKEPGIT
jgi:hypothetical protein